MERQQRTTAAPREQVVTSGDADDGTQADDRWAGQEFLLPGKVIRGLVAA